MHCAEPDAGSHAKSHAGTEPRAAISHTFGHRDPHAEPPGANTHTFGYGDPHAEPAPSGHTHPSPTEPTGRAEPPGTAEPAVFTEPS